MTLLAVIFAATALLTAYTYVLVALWLRYGERAYEAVWSFFVALGRADDRLNAEIDALTAAKRAGG